MSKTFQFRLLANDMLSSLTSRPDAGSVQTKQIGFYQNVLLFLYSYSWKHYKVSIFIELFKTLEGIHVILFHFLIASGFIPDARSSDKLRYIVLRVNYKGF